MPSIHGGPHFFVPCTAPACLVNRAWIIDPALFLLIFSFPHKGHLIHPSPFLMIFPSLVAWQRYLFLEKTEDLKVNSHFIPKCIARFGPFILSSLFHHMAMIKVAFSQRIDSFYLNIQFPAKFLTRSENLDLPNTLPRW